MGIAELAFAFMAGATVSGTAASLLELAGDTPVSFAEPYVSRSRVTRSILTIVIAGPAMFTNDMLAAYRDGRISAAYLAFYAATPIVWATSLGVVRWNLRRRVSGLYSRCRS